MIIEWHHTRQSIYAAKKDMRKDSKILILDMSRVGILSNVGFVTCNKHQDFI